MDTWHTHRGTPRVTSKLREYRRYEAYGMPGLHFGHVDNLALFPTATLRIARKSTNSCLARSAAGT